MGHMKFTLLLSLAVSTLYAAIPAFPGAEGAGAMATGGRGGSVYIVTSLEKDGPGTLADAVSAPNRIIVFAVSGIIDLDGKKLEIAQPNITIAGQTAPGEGICLKHGTLKINASNVIVRHIRVRRGFIEEGDAGDAVEINFKDPGYVKPKFKGTDKDKPEAPKPLGADFKPITDIVVDHVSASWATDENFTMSGHIDRVHAQYCLIAEGLDYPNPKQTPTQHAFGSLFGGAGTDTRVGMHHSIFAHHRRRTPQCSAGDGSGDPPVLVDFRNNIVYDSIEAFSHTGGHPIRLNFINNIYKAGPSTLPEIRGHWFTFQKSDASRLHASGNLIFDNAAATEDNWKGILYEKKVAFTPELVVAQAFDVAQVTTQLAKFAYESDLMQSGATLPARDAVDTRVAQQVRDRTGKVIHKETDLQQSWPDYQSLPPLADVDSDGLPDSWEKQVGLNPKDANDSAKLAPDGYAFIEHYLNNTSPIPGDKRPIVMIAAQVARCSASQTGVLRLSKSGKQTVGVKYQISGDAHLAGDAAPGGDVDIGMPPLELSFPGKIDVKAMPVAVAGRKLLIELLPAPAYLIGCPSRGMVIVE